MVPTMPQRMELGKNREKLFVKHNFSVRDYIHVVDLAHGHIAAVK
jgi:hypothetical protein